MYSVRASNNYDEVVHCTATDLIHALQFCYTCTPRPGGDSDDSCKDFHIPMLYLYFYQNKLTWTKPSTGCANWQYNHDVFGMADHNTPYVDYKDTYSNVQSDVDCTALSPYHGWVNYYGFDFGTQLELKATLACTSGTVISMAADTANNTSTMSDPPGLRVPRWSARVRPVKAPLNDGAFLAPVREEPPITDPLASDPVAVAASSAVLPNVLSPGFVPPIMAVANGDQGLRANPPKSLVVDDGSQAGEGHLQPSVIADGANGHR